MRLLDVSSVGWRECQVWLGSVPVSQTADRVTIDVTSVCSCLQQRRFVAWQWLGSLPSAKTVPLESAESLSTFCLQSVGHADL